MGRAQRPDASSAGAALPQTLISLGWTAHCFQVCLSAKKSFDVLLLQNTIPCTICVVFERIVKTRSWSIRGSSPAQKRRLHRDEIRCFDGRDIVGRRDRVGLNLLSWITLLFSVPSSWSPLQVFELKIMIQKYSDAANKQFNMSSRQSLQSCGI